MHGLMRVHDAKGNICSWVTFVIGPADGCEKKIGWNHVNSAYYPSDGHRHPFPELTQAMVIKSALTGKLPKGIWPHNDKTDGGTKK